MKNLNVKFYKEKDEASLYGGYAINRLIEQYKDTPTLLLISGGSAMELLESINMDHVGQQLTVSVLDERFSEDAKINNFLQLQKSDFYIQALQKDCSFIGTAPRPGETHQQLAERFETRLKAWREENPAGIILTTLGMGSDGHTAGIMPFPEDKIFFEKTFCSDSWVAAYNAAGKNPYPLRITTTITFLKQITAAVAFITGEEKRLAFEKLQKKQASLHEQPAMVFWDMNNLEIYTDIT